VERRCWSSRNGDEGSSSWHAQRPRGPGTVWGRRVSSTAGGVRSGVLLEQSRSIGPLSSVTASSKEQLTPVIQLLLVHLLIWLVSHARISCLWGRTLQTLILS
jgi:hypothetical protein